jgi:uncharacterized protein (UPF0335 family)
MSAVRELLPQGKEKDDDQPMKMASNKKIKEFADRIMKKMADRDNLNADIKGEYDLADSQGIDRKALKTAIKHKYSKSATATDEHKTTVNAYLHALGELPLFATGNLH